MAANRVTSPDGAFRPNDPITRAEMEARRQVQELLGHERLATTEIYTHVDNESLRVAAKANPLSRVKMKGKIEDKEE